MNEDFDTYGTPPTQVQKFYSSRIDDYKSATKSIHIAKSLVPKCACSDLCKILVVDDNIFNVMTLQMILKEGFNLESDKALNGQEALKLLRERRT